MKKKFTFTALVAAAATTANAQVSFIGDVYTQDFDALLATENASATYVDNSTIAGWYVNLPEPTFSAHLL